MKRPKKNQLHENFKMAHYGNYNFSSKHKHSRSAGLC